jgi:hypothetical protein
LFVAIVDGNAIHGGTDYQYYIVCPLTITQILLSIVLHLANEEGLRLSFKGLEDFGIYEDNATAMYLFQNSD